MAIIAAVSVRPRLWVTALVTVGRLAGPGWWHRPPYLPLPDTRLWAFRMETAYGRADVDPEVDDVLAYLEWCGRGVGHGAYGRHHRRGGRTCVWTSIDGDGGPTGSRLRSSGSG
jgi:hypothetical protein